MTDNLFSTDSEMAVLSLILNNPDFAFSVNDLRPFMFSSTAYQIIFNEIEETVGRNLVPDPSLLVMSLDAGGNLPKCGGKETIQYIYKQTYPKENFHEYVSIVIGSFRARSFISLASQIKSDTVTLDNVEAKIQEFRKGVEQLENNSATGSTVHIGTGANEVYEEIVARTKNPGVRGIPWGFRKVDLLTGGKNPAELVILAGRPGSGKTAVMCNAALNDGRSGVPSLIFSKEMNYSTMLERMVAIDSGVGISNIRLGIINQVQLDQIRDSLKRIKAMPIYLDTNFMMDVITIENTIKKYNTLHGVKVAYLDYIQLVAERDENMTHALGKISRMLKNLANGLDLSIVTLSQLNREVEHRDNKRPLMSDLKQSGSLEEDADIVVGLYRDEYYNKDTKFPGLMEFNILKNRNGPVGSITLDFKSETNKVLGD
jgi:replicative DNA helicase